MRTNGIIRRLFLIGGAMGIAALFGCAPKPSPPPPVATTRTAKRALPEPYGFRDIRTRSNVRAEPTTSGKIVTTLDAGTTVGLLSLKDGWYRILADSTTGWVWAPLLRMNDNDRWEAAMSAAQAGFPNDGLFKGMFRREGKLTIILDLAWRDMTKPQKERIVARTGEAWKRAAERMGITPAPAIRFMSNNEVEMARWHAFWGATVEH